jgi:hypothetical protein
MITITLPFPPSSLSGHNTGNRFVKAKVVKEWRGLAAAATRRTTFADGDINVTVEFYPPNNRGDRMNYWNRMKPIFDGIADGLGVNDKRFTPAGHHVAAADKAKGYVVVKVWQG